MAEQNEVKQNLFDSGIDQQAENLVLNMEKAKLQIQNRDAVKNWIKSYIQKGFSTVEINQQLQAYNYDFDNAAHALDKLHEAKSQAAEAKKGVEEMKKEKAKEKRTKKLSSQITWIISAFMFGGVGLFLALMLGKQNDELAQSGANLGMAGNLMGNLVKGGWIVAIAGGIVGLFLLVLTLATYFKDKSKKQGTSQEDVEAKRKEIEQKMQSEQPVQQTKTPPPKKQKQPMKKPESSERLQTQAKQNLK